MRRLTGVDATISKRRTAKGKTRWLAAFSVSILSLWVYSGEANARVLRVGKEEAASSKTDGGGGGYTTISSAIEDALPGDEVRVDPGVYREPLVLKPGVAVRDNDPSGKSSLAETGFEVNRPVIDVSGLSCRAVSGAEGAVLDGFTVTGGEAELGAGIYCEDCNFEIRNCTIRGNKASRAGGGIYSRDCALQIENCDISGNESSEGGAGLHIEDEQSDAEYKNGAEYKNRTVSISSSKFSGNTGYGVYCYNSEVTLYRCVLTKNARGALLDSNSDLVLINCTIVDNGAYSAGGAIQLSYTELYVFHTILWNPGIEILDRQGSTVKAIYNCIQGGYPGEGNIDGSPKFVSGTDYRLLRGSSCIDAALNTKTIYNGEAVDIGAYESPEGTSAGPRFHTPRILYVDPDAPAGGVGLSWAYAFRTIGEALAISNTGDEIWVKRGVYPESIRMEPSVSLYGGFAGNEKIRDERDWQSHETKIDASAYQGTAVWGASGVLDGFTVSGGTRTTDSQQNLGALYCQGQDIRIANCTFADNDYSSNGAVCLSTDASATILGSTVAENNYAGVRIQDSAYHVRLLMKDCQILKNDGWGLLFGHTSFVRIIGCYFKENERAVSGGDTYAVAEIENCIFTGHRPASNSGTIATPAGQFLIHNCIIADNTGDGAGIRVSASVKMDIRNSILWNLGPTEISGSTGGVAVNYCCIRNGYSGQGNISQDPFFVRAESADYRLRPDSPCIDAGDPSPEFCDSCMPPGQGSQRCDMGAFGGGFNCQPASDQVPVTFYVSVSGGGDKTGRSWADAFDSIGKALEAAKRGDEIWVQTGTYRESIILKKGVTLLGGFLGGEAKSEERDWLTNTTVIDASGCATSAVIGADDARIDGFTITGGAAEDGGGIYCDANSMIIQNCTITGNHATSNGGGIYAYADGARIENCRIEGNYAGDEGGGGFFAGSRILISNCNVLGNKAGYGGGGMSLFGDGPLVTRGCQIQRNYAARYGGGILSDSDECTIRNCLIVANECNYRGSGICASGYYYSRIYLFNDVMTENYGSSAFTIYLETYSLVANTIIWGSTPQIVDVDNRDWGGLSLYHSDVMDVQGEDLETDSNISEDPKFVYPWDGQWGDFRLQEDSPCIDAGMSDYPNLDLYQPPGLGGRRNDMGAFGGITNNVTFMGFPFDSGSPVPSPTPTTTATATPSASPTETPTPTIYWTPTPSPSETPIPTPTPAGPRLWILHGNGKVYSLPGEDD